MTMLKAQYDRRGPVPHEVIRAVPLELPPPAPGQALVAMLAAPINPSNLLTLTGEYAVLPALPAVGGSEGVGRIGALGEGVDGLSLGQLVLLPRGSGTWVTHLLAEARSLVPLPEVADPLQLAMLTVNPPTASLMLSEFVPLVAGDWVIQNVANSAVGRHVIVLAKARGVRTLNVVRRDDVAGELRDIGADVVVQDGPDLAERARAATGGASIKLGIDAVSGEACKRIGDCIAEGGVVVSYGSMSGQDPVMSRAAVNMRGVNLTGFNLGRGLAKRTREQVRAIYADLAGKLRDGLLEAPIDAFYPIEEIRAALIRAQQGGRDGKVLVLPNGALQ